MKVEDAIPHVQAERGMLWIIRVRFKHNWEFRILPEKQLNVACFTNFVLVNLVDENMTFNIKYDLNNLTT